MFKIIINYDETLQIYPIIGMFFYSTELFPTITVPCLSNTYSEIPQRLNFLNNILASI